MLIEISIFMPDLQDICPDPKLITATIHTSSGDSTTVSLA